ncbi:hypothetical protein SAMN05421788_11042 [Filimonas lacunae]|uniref:DUF2304 domain-containing protein n=1 Tax=Filimonas lacunae TaxID=477680 RepID=A0A173M9W6_9BACT|nr:DUF2304 domain-containing protein [Filimonas lacunae]BAV04312.1 hypothetical protein FLA_0299 [Filimonas lacunae]SIT30991.1 hypothetical protein SAMN05421788_11042 [Filimonas lacunae]
MARIQLITIIVDFLFVLYISRLIVKGKLREEYAVVWIACTALLTLFSLWRDGLEVLAKLFGVYAAPNLVFTVLIFLILIYLLHLSVVNSKLQKNVTRLTQEMALLQEKLEKEK